MRRVHGRESRDAEANIPSVPFRKMPERTSELGVRSTRALRWCALGVARVAYAQAPPFVAICKQLWVFCSRTPSCRRFKECLPCYKSPSNGRQRTPTWGFPNPVAGSGFFPVANGRWESFQRERCSCVPPRKSKRASSRFTDAAASKVLQCLSPSSAVRSGAHRAVICLAD